MIVRPSTAGSRPGMTLLEVLVSMAILLIGFAALSTLIDFGTRNAVDATRQADATRLAISKLAEVEAGVVPLDQAASGTFDIEPEWSWSMESSPTDVPNVYLISVTVTRSPGGTNFKMSQMIFDSRQMGNSSEVVKPTTTTGSTTP